MERRFATWIQGISPDLAAGTGSFESCNLGACSPDELLAVFRHVQVLRAPPAVAGEPSCPPAVFVEVEGRQLYFRPDGVGLYCVTTNARLSATDAVALVAGRPGGPDQPSHGPAVPAMPAAEPPQGAAVAWPAASVRPPRHRRWWPALVVLAAGVLAVAVVGLVFLGRGREAAEPAAEPASEPASGSSSSSSFPTAIRFRDVARRDTVAAAQLFDGGELLTPLLERPRASAHAALWPLFFTGALVAAGTGTGGRLVVAYYNPFFDAAVLLGWRVDDSTARIDRLAVRLGASLSASNGAAPREPARWLVSSEPAPLALATQTRAFLADFEARFPPSGRGGRFPGPAVVESELELLEAHLVVQLTQLVALHDRTVSNVGDYLLDVRRRLADGDAAGLEALLPAGSAPSAQTLAGMHPEVREEVRAQYAVLADQAAVLFLTPGGAPRFCGILELALDPPNRRATPRRFTFHDIGADGGEVKGAGEGAP